jgi:hypothetical protein
MDTICRNPDMYIPKGKVVEFSSGIYNNYVTETIVN